MSAAAEKKGETVSHPLGSFASRRRESFSGGGKVVRGGPLRSLVCSRAFLDGKRAQSAPVLLRSGSAAIDYEWRRFLTVEERQGVRQKIQLAYEKACTT